MGRRVDAEDTIDPAVHFLHRLQAEGWGVEAVTCAFEYGSVGNRQLPLAANVTVRLVPARK